MVFEPFGFLFEFVSVILGKNVFFVLSKKTEKCFWHYSIHNHSSVNGAFFPILYKMLQSKCAKNTYSVSKFSRF